MLSRGPTRCARLPLGSNSLRDIVHFVLLERLKKAKSQAMTGRSPAPKAACSLYFGIPLKARATSRNWQNTVRDFNRTLASIYNQTNPNFRILVACHEVPSLMFPADARLTFLPVTSPPPAREQIREQSFADRAEKLRLIGARFNEEGGRWFMRLDADDLVSSRLVDFVLGSPNPTGYIVRKGYILDQGTGAITPFPHPGVSELPFHQHCGSCAILRFEQGDFSNDHGEYPDCRFARFAGSVNHIHIQRLSVEEGRRLTAVPFRAVTYVVNTGDNLSFEHRPELNWRKERMLPAIRARSIEIDEETRAEFALNHPLWDARATADTKLAAKPKQACSTVPERLVDIVVPTHRRPDLLRKLLAALVPQLQRSSAAAIRVVNDGTHDWDYAEVIRAFEPWVEYVVLERSLGPAHARNLGASRSRAQFIVFTDDDCRPPAHWLDWLLSLIASFPDVDVFGGTTKLPSPGATMSYVERFARLNRLHPRPMFERGMMFCLPTANVAVRRATFVQSGGFDEDFRYAAGEDLEFFHRLKLEGCRFYIDPLWWTEHPVEIGLLPFLKRRYRYGYGIQQCKNRATDTFHFYVDHDATRWQLARRVPAVFTQAWRDNRASQSSLINRGALAALSTSHFLALQLGAIHARQAEASLPKGLKR